MWRRAEALVQVTLMILVASAIDGCKKDGGGNGPPPAPAEPANLTGTAILDVKLLESPVNIGPKLTPPANAFPGYTPLDMDLNESTGGNYVWLYYKTGPADGSQGTPLGEIYTVDKTEGEALKSDAHTQLPVNLTSHSIVVGHEIYLTFQHSAWPVVRGIAVANVDTEEDTQVIKYVPPEVEGKYPVFWVQERSSTEAQSAEAGKWGPNPQDLNEGTSFLLPPFFNITDYIYIGYCLDQEYYDWLKQQ